MNLKARIIGSDRSGSRKLFTDGTNELTSGELFESSISIGDMQVADTGVAICMHSAFDFIRTICALDGRVKFLLLLSPDLSRHDIQILQQTTGSLCLITDRNDLAEIAQPWQFLSGKQHACSNSGSTWLMTTSGTTGQPKIIAHTLESLTAKLRPPKLDAHPVWGLLYEPSRFAGLQVVLQSLLGGGCLVVPDRMLSVASQLSLLANERCTHLSGTPSLWRKLLMSPAAEKLELQQITLGGETADERVLKALAQCYPKARITQIYASTEAGVGFSSHDGMPGFPMQCLESRLGYPDFKIMDGELWARRPHALQPMSAFDMPKIDEDGYFGTGDMVEMVGQRILFRGRQDGVANVGGTKIHIEDVEAVVRQHEQVLECRISKKPSSILGTVLSLQVVARGPGADPQKLQHEITTWCRSMLPRAARPVTTTIVPSLPTNASGKVSREP
jgi:acyl-coenzyme A synthetase/AMP-(fatty) acid ligase